jgi:demethylmenaquinone methyltransferase/2-methoxy-6-polyprenyl-1,4-benzoquinol methylase
VSHRNVLPDPSEKATEVRRMFDRISPRYDLVNRLISLGMDVRWRRRTVAALGLPAGSLVADLACGTADLCREVNRCGCRAVGFDFSQGMLAKAKTQAPLVLADIQQLPVPDEIFDGVVCGFALRNVSELPRFFEEVARVLSPGGRFSFLEVDRPGSKLLQVGHRIWFDKAVPAIGGLLSDGGAYRYLPSSFSYLPSPEEMSRLLGAAGFADLGRESLAGGAAQILTGAKR